MTEDMDEEPGDYVEVTFGEHALGMTRRQAEELTDAERADYTASLARSEAARGAELLAEAATQDRALAALHEDGLVVLEGWCDQCGVGAEPIMRVHRFSDGGYLFVGLGAPPKSPAGFDEYHLRRLRSGGTRRVPFVHRSMSPVILTEEVQPGTEWPPKAACARHGEVTPDPVQLLKQARMGGAGGRPAKVTLHPVT